MLGLAKEKSRDFQVLSKELVNGTFKCLNTSSISNIRISHISWGALNSLKSKMFSDSRRVSTFFIHSEIMCNILHSWKDGGAIKEKQIANSVKQSKTEAHERVVWGLERQFFGNHPGCINQSQCI